MASNGWFKNPAVLGGIAVLVVGGAFAAWKFTSNPQANDAAPVAQQAVVPAPAPAAPAPAVAAAPSVTGKVTASPASTRNSNVPTAVTAASHGAGDGNGAPVVTAVGQPAPVTTPHLDEHLTYQYNALGRRDPFQSLVDGQFVGADVGGDAPPDPGGIKVVGIVWGASDQFALVEDVRGNSFVLRKGDKVQNGFVEGLKRDGVIVSITAEGQSQSVVIPLTRKGEQNAR